jgi:hypothetical protein
MNNYADYCKVFTKGLKTAINKYKGPCSAKEFDNIIDGFVTDLYGIKPELQHPFATEQDAYNFAYCIIFTITSTTAITMDEFKRITGDVGGRLPEQFLQDMYTHIMERKNSSKKLVEQVIASTTKMHQTLTDYEVIKSANENGNESEKHEPDANKIKVDDPTVVDSEKKVDDTANSYCSIM